VANNGQVQTFVVSELVQVKKLADQLGGAGKLREVVAVLERLI
jgi:hypothetical protein